MKAFQLIVLVALLKFSHSVNGAVHLSASKTGSAIIVPFYTVSNQMNTLLSLNNTTDHNKAVKIHFKEANNGDILTSFNVYLSAQDIWTMTTGQVVSTEGGKIKMVSSDQSCTIGFPNDEIIPVEEDWLWENGTIEIIEMGAIADFDPLENDNSDCEEYNYRWQAGQPWSTDSEFLLSAASGGLHAEVTLMDVEQGHSANIPVLHLNGFFGEDNIQHTPAGDAFPNLSSGTKTSMVINNGQMIETTWPTGYEAISALLMKSTLSNEFNLENDVGAQTEWIVSFPTISYHLAENDSSQPFKISNSDNKHFWFPYFFSDAVHFFNREGHIDHYQCYLAVCPPTPADILGHSVENLIVNHYDSDQDSHQGPIPEPFLTNSSSGNTKYFYAPWNLLGTSHDFFNGKIKINLTPESGYSVANNRGFHTIYQGIIHEYHGLPVVGFAYTKFSNANAQPGLLAQYAFVREHFGQMKVVFSEN